MLDGYAVEWRTFDGTQPAATSPLEIFVDDPAVQPTDQLRKVQGTSLVDPGGTVEQGDWFVDFTTDPAFVVIRPGSALPAAPPGPPGPAVVGTPRLTG
jgi:hypothetical protein